MDTPRGEAPPTDRRLVLCADDFGVSPPVSEAIVRLLRAGRLSAVSCLANAPGWAADAPRLRDLPATARVGLHFNLTEGRPLSAELTAHWPAFPTLPRLIALAHARRLPSAALRCEWQTQLEAFTRHHGRRPAMVDGHQHVHHLPGVRDVVLGGVQALARETARPVYVRCTGRVLGPGFALKRRLIEHTGGRRLAQRLQRAALAHNRWLLGVYDFVVDDYRALMRTWLAHAPVEGALLFCHPGVQRPGDAIGPARAREFAYLASPAFEDDLAASRTRLVPPDGGT